MLRFTVLLSILLSSLLAACNPKVTIDPILPRPNRTPTPSAAVVEAAP
ncbi:MAG: hypothetical protein NW237_13040 [Cyanobacteriota bacterium]|nr:hypothetical protein [Cyanobacteriota bacterium]